MSAFLKRQTPQRIVAAGFLLLILLGSLLLSLPCSVREGVRLSYTDALYTSTSAVCVTGLVTVDPGDTFTPLGQLFLALLIQVGGLGVTAVGVSVILLMNGRVNLRERRMLSETLNLLPGRSMGGIVRGIFLTTLFFELAGAALSFIVFVQDHAPLRAAGLSLFHAISAFNNAGFDVLGGGRSLGAYADNVLLNMVTCALIICGGLGFLVLRELRETRLRLRRLSMHSSVVLAVSGALIAFGTLFIKLAEGGSISWLGALFASVSARTAGFATYPLGGFSNAGLLAVAALIFIGASPGSTGGGIKTSTFFVLLHGLKGAATNKKGSVFRYSVPEHMFKKAAVVLAVSLAVVLSGSCLMALLEPQMPMRDVLFETVSAFGTAGLSTGVTPSLGTAAKLLSMLIMFIGRVGPLTFMTVWHFGADERVKYPDGNIAVG